MRKHTNRHLLVLTLGLLATLLSLASLATLLSTDFQEPTGAAVIRPEQTCPENTQDIELYEGYEQQIDLNQDGRTDTTIISDYADDGLTHLRLQNACPA